MIGGIDRTTALVTLAALLGLGACSDQGFTDRFQLDSWQQSRRNELDLLVVIDNSCSMFQEQENLAGNFDALIDTFATAEVDWQIAVTTTDVEVERFRGRLISGDDEIIVRGPNGEIDRVEYDRTWIFDEGVALQLMPDKYAPTMNLAVENWCPAKNAYVEGSFGSPGVWNPDCDGAAVSEPELGEDMGPRSPRYGDVIVTEIMAAADGIDSHCEWFELTNRSNHTLTMDGVTLSDEGNNRVAVAAGLRMAPHQVLVVGRSLDTDLNCDVPVDIAAETGWALQDHVPVLNVETEDADERFAEMIAQGTQGSGIEHGLEGARLVFEEPYYTEQNQNWLREDAALAILIVSDEDDVSPHSVAYYERAYKEVKGLQAFRQDGWFTLNAIVGTQPTDSHIDVSCESDNGQAFYASRYIELAARTGGLVESICEEDFSPIVKNLGLSISGLELQFSLRYLPVVDTLEVKLYEDQDEDSLVAELVADVDYTYVADGNYLLFNEDQIPPAEYYITARYRPLATGSTVEGGE
jgi:hypothetical protein